MLMEGMLGVSRSNFSNKKRGGQRPPHKWKKKDLLQALQEGNDGIGLVTTLLLLRHLGLLTSSLGNTLGVTHPSAQLLFIPYSTCFILGLQIASILETFHRAHFAANNAEQIWTSLLLATLIKGMAGLALGFGASNGIGGAHSNDDKRGCSSKQ